MSVGPSGSDGREGVEGGGDGSAGWSSPIPAWTTDPFATRTTVHGLASDEVRSALHKHIRRGRVQEAILTAVELARTDDAHEAMLWSRLQIIAAEDVGMGAPMVPATIRALREGVLDADPGSFDRLVFAAQAAGLLARSPKDPTNVEIMQLGLLEDRAPQIPPEAICVHTRRGQESGHGMAQWFTDAAVIVPEVPDRDLSWRTRVLERYLAEEAGPTD